MLETLFTPTEFAALKSRDLRDTVCLVFDILRATTSMMTALGNGASAIMPVAEIPEAVAVRQSKPEVLLAGEREGLRIRAAQTGSVDFDLGNSPREFVPECVRGKTIVMTTTNGTRALKACTRARKVFIGSFLNLSCLGKWIERHRPQHLLLVCAGTFEQAAYEDTLAAGAVADYVWNSYTQIDDSTQMARQIYLSSQADLISAMRFSRNGRRLMQNPDLSGDVQFCLQRDTLNFVAEMQDGLIRRTDFS